MKFLEYDCLAILIVLCTADVIVIIVTVWAKSSAAIDPRLTGQELLQQWLAKHPEIITRAVTGLQPEGGTEPATRLSKMKRSDLMKSGYTSVTGMKYPAEVAQELANITDLPPSLHCNR